ncbi:MAG TPA: hypothetical protein VNO20_01000 [Solirubrobacterales bacterium]|nr:hypothetical protein [Solirubrobacterales bacterium]
MANALSQDELRPYQSALVARIEDGGEISAAQIARRLKKVLRVRVGDSGRHVVASGAGKDPGAAFFRYVDKRQVPWASTPVLDRVNHLAVVLVKGAWVAIHTTEGSRRDTIKRALRKGSLGPLELIRPGHLKAAFIKGPARTLWMRGTHRRIASKADTKTLSGLDLAGALDPTGDQSYRYTAARVVPDNEKIGEVMGLAVDQSRLWIGPSANWTEFQTSMLATLDALEETVGTDVEPLPVLAAAKTDLTDVDGAYDIAISPPEMMLLGPVLDSGEAAVLAELEKLAFGTQFEVADSNGTGVKANVLRRGHALGQLEIEFREGDGEIETVVAGTSEPGREEDFNEVLGKLSEPETLTVYFESGHTIQGHQVFSVRHRDIPFAGWSWVPFGVDWAVEREKPSDGVGAIGTDTSLFDWVLASWPLNSNEIDGRGWLACDDRPGETADFLHIDESGDVPILTLMHVKGAKSASQGREIAVVPYETVCAQAVKNLRHLDAVLASGNMLSGTIPVELGLSAWENSEKRSRKEFVKRLDGLGTNFGRKIVIVQPHVRRDLVASIRVDPEHAQAPRLRQLDTLLHGVAANCQSAGAELLVIGST